MRLKPRWTLGAFMVLIAVLAVPLAWYVHRAREFARRQAVADAQRAAMASQVNQLFKLVDDPERLDQALKRFHDREKLEQDRSSPEPALPKGQSRSIPDQVRNIVDLMDDRAKLEAKIARSRAEVRARLDKRRLDLPVAETEEPPR